MASKQHSNFLQMGAENSLIPLRRELLQLVVLLCAKKVTSTMYNASLTTGPPSLPRWDKDPVGVCNSNKEL